MSFTLPGSFLPLRLGPWQGVLRQDHEETALLDFFREEEFPPEAAPGKIETVASNIGGTYRLSLPAAGEVFYTKNFLFRRFSARAASLFRPSPAVRTWKALLICEETGIPAPRPVAFLERKKNMMPWQSVVITEAIAAAQEENLEFYFRKKFDRHPLPAELLGEKRELIRLLGELFRQVHAQDRIYFPDFHPHNLVLQKTPEHGLRLFLLDFDEVRFRLRPDDRMKNLASLGRNADKINRRMSRPGITTGDRLRFLQSYLGPAGAEFQAVWNLWREIQRNWNLK